MAIFRGTVSRIKLWLSILLFSFVSGMGALLLGFEIGYNRLGPPDLMYQVDRYFTMAVRFFVPREEPGAGGYYSSGLLRIEDNFVDVPKEIETSVGGGLTSFGDDVLVVTQSGSIYAASSHKDIEKTSIIAPDNGYADYLDVSTSPEFKEYSFDVTRLRYNDLQYYKNKESQGLAVSYTQFYKAEACYRNVVSVLEFDLSITSIDELKAGPEDWNVLYQSEPCLPFKKYYLAIEAHMAGGRLAFQSPDSLFLANGDFHWDGMRSSSEETILAQDPDVHYGKIVELNVSDGTYEVISTGHRNPQGIAISGNGDLYLAEHGPKGGDELNKILRGKNYGWPLESLGTTYQGLPIPNSLSFARHENFEAPQFSWFPSVAISSLAYVGSFHEAWNGDLLAGSLIDKSLHRIRMQDGAPLYSERIEIGERIRHVHEHSNGQIVLWTDKHRLHFLSPVQQGAEFGNIKNIISRLEVESTTKQKIQSAVFACAECHSFVYGDDIKSPNLSSIYNADIASTGFKSYSDALKRLEGQWQRDNLKQYLQDPGRFAPGTYMPNPNLNDEAVLDGVVSVLQSLEKQF